MPYTSVNHYDHFAEYYNLLMLGGYYDYQAQARTLATLIPEGTDILEIGVGTGLMLRELLALGYSVAGIDHTQAMLEQARDLLGLNVPLFQADVTDFDLGRRFGAALSNGGVWYGVWWKDGRFGYCGHLPDPGAVRASLRCVARHIAPGGQLVLSLQDAHVDKTMPLPDGVTYEQRIHDKGNGVFDKEYIFVRDSDGERICYERLTLCYIDSALFEGQMRDEGFTDPEVSKDKRYMIFTRSEADPF